MMIRGREDPRLVARIIRSAPMRYRAGADPSADRPAHVRAASGLAWIGDRLAVVQDDANFIALVDPLTGLADAIALPADPAGRRQFDDGRGNRHHKLDLEAVTTVPAADGPTLLAIGSGSLPNRERIVIVRGVGTAAPTVEVLPVPALFAALREEARFAGSEMNVEGLLHLGDRLRLFGRGNGAVRGDLQPIDATCDLGWEALETYLAHPDGSPPRPTNVVRYELGTLRGARLSFTDAALAWAPKHAVERVIVTATAEASPDAVRDGPVTGSVIGVIEHQRELRWAELTDGDGAPWSGKAEGIALVPGARRAFIAVDHDDHERPSDLCEVELTGPWFGAPTAEFSNPR